MINEDLKKLLIFKTIDKEEQYKELLEYHNLLNASFVEGDKVYVNLTKLSDYPNMLKLIEELQ